MVILKSSNIYKISMYFLFMKKISIIVTAYREPHIGRCIESIINQKLPKETEIVIVAPDNKTLNIAKKYALKDKRIRLIRDPGKGKPTALNLAFKEAKGKILILTDGDVYLGKDSINLLIKNFNSKKVGAVSGHVIYEIKNNNLFYEWAKLSEKIFNKVRLKLNKNGKLTHPTGYLYAIRKGIIKEIPQNTLSDDALIGYLITSKGYTIKYEPKAKVFVKFPTTTRDFINQKTRTRAGFVQIKKWYGYIPRRITNEIKFGISDLIRAYHKNLLKGLIVALIYIYTWVKAIIVINLNKRFDKIWTRIESTK